MASKSRSERWFFLTHVPAALVSTGVLAMLFLVLLHQSLPALKAYGLSLFAESAWSPSEKDPTESRYGLLAPLAGTLVTSLIAVALAIPLAVSAVLFGEEVLPRGLGSLRGAYSSLFEVMIGLPTVVYGLWGLSVLSPLLEEGLYQALYRTLGFLPLLSCEPLTGSTVLTAGILLAVMVTPLVYVVVLNAYRQVPHTLREAALSLGATRYEYARIMLGLIRPAIVAGALLGFGRAAGETVAVAMVVGNTLRLPTCLLAPSYTVSSLIANQFGNAGLYPLMTSVLLAGGLMLLLLGMASSLVAFIYLRRANRFA